MSIEDRSEPRITAKVLGTSPPGHPHVKRQCALCEGRAKRVVYVEFRVGLDGTAFEVYVCPAHAKAAKRDADEFGRSLLKALS